MPRRPVSGTPGLIKHHRRGCLKKLPLTSCRCPWWASYKGVEVSLAAWSGQEVSPLIKGPAETVLNRLKAAVDAKKFSREGEDRHKSGEQTLREFVREYEVHWLDERGMEATSTRAALGVIVKALGARTLNELTADDGSLLLERWLNALQRQRKFSNATWCHYHELLRRLFNRAIKWRRIKAANPMLYVDRKIVSSPPTPPRIEEDAEDRLLAACDQLDELCAPPPNRTTLNWAKVGEIRARVGAGGSQREVAVAFGVSASCVCEIVSGKTWSRERFGSGTTGHEMRRRVIAAFDLGLRAGEMLRVTLPMIDYTPRIVVTDDGVRHEVLVITLPPDVTKGGKRTGREERVYAGTDRIKEVLHQRRERLRDNPAFRQFVFAREDGGFVGSFDRPWRRLFSLAGLDWGRDRGLVWHTVRHEFVSRTGEQTRDPVVAQAMARHKDIRTTQRYLHARPTRLLAAAVGLDRARVAVGGRVEAPSASAPAATQSAAAEAPSVSAAGAAPPAPRVTGQLLVFPTKSA